MGLLLVSKKIYLPQSPNLFFIHLTYVVLPLTFKAFIRHYYSAKPAIIPEVDNVGVMTSLTELKAVLTKIGVALIAIPKSMQVAWQVSECRQTYPFCPIALLLSYIMLALKFRLFSHDAGKFWKRYKIVTDKPPPVHTKTVN